MVNQQEAQGVLHDNVFPFNVATPTISHVHFRQTGLSVRSCFVTT